MKIIICIKVSAIISAPLMGEHKLFKKWGCMNGSVEKKIYTCKEKDKGKRLREHLIVSSCKCTACWGHLGLYETMFWIYSQPPPVPSTSPCSSIDKQCIYYNTNEFPLVNDGIMRIHILRNTQKQSFFLPSIRVMEIMTNLGHDSNGFLKEIWQYDNMIKWNFIRHVLAGKLETGVIRFQIMLKTFDVRRGLIQYTFIVIQHAVFVGKRAGK